MLSSDKNIETITQLVAQIAQNLQTERGTDSQHKYLPTLADGNSSPHR